MKTTKIFAMLLSLACATGFYSCSDDEEVKPALQNPTVTETAGTYNSLSFEWNEVANSVQYGYRLTNADGIAIEAGVTYGRSVTFTDLQPATTYTLQVWAFASMDGDYSTPPAVTLTATTDALVKLATPAGLTLASEDGYTFTASWNAVTDAVSYSYTVRNAEGTQIVSKTTESTSVTLKDLENGDYVFYVYAVAGEGYTDGDAASASFKVDKPVVEPSISVDELVGTYDNHFVGTEYLTSGDWSAKNWDATWHAYTTIKKATDSSIVLDGLFFTNDPVTGVINFEEMTITFELKDTYNTYYRLCDGNDPNAPAVGYINGDGTISVPDFGLYYNHGSNSKPDWEWYLYGTSTLTKVTEK